MLYKIICSKVMRLTAEMMKLRMAVPPPNKIDVVKVIKLKASERFPFSTDHKDSITLNMQGKSLQQITVMMQEEVGIIQADLIIQTYCAILKSHRSSRAESGF